MKSNLEKAGQQILDKQLALAQLITSLHFQQHPELEMQYGAAGKEKCIQDSLYHLTYLSEAVKAGSKAMFISYIEWALGMLQARKIPMDDLLNNLQYTIQACNTLLPAEDCEIINEYIQSGIETLQCVNTLPETFITADNPLQIHAKAFLDALLKGDRKIAQQQILQLVHEGVTIASIYENIFQMSQYEVGLLWQTNKITVAHEHYCTAATQLIMASLYPYIFDSEKKGAKLLACTVSGDLHEIGIRMVSDFFEMDGWDTYYLGANMPDSNVISAAKEQQSDILAISVTMPFHVSKVESLIKKIRTDDSLQHLKIIVGGYPFRLIPDLWHQVGADGSANSAKEAISMANQMFSKN